jgi:tetratricopeptide (TPR) repeat protein
MQRSTAMAQANSARARSGAAPPAAGGSQGASAPGLGPLWRFGLPALLCLLAFASFAPALRQGFVELDDDRNFAGNPHILSLSAENLRWMLTQSHVGHYHPLTWLSIALETQLWGGLDPQRIHRTNLLLHALTALLAYHLALGLLRAGFERRTPPVGERALRLTAALAAALFAVHPLRAESVAWATERRDVLSAPLLFGSVLCWLACAVGRGGRGLHFASVALYLLSLLSKAWGLTLPAVLLAADVFLGRPARVGWPKLLLEKLIWYVPFAVASAALAAWAQGGAAALMPWSEHGALQRLAQASYGLFFYPFKTLWPANLSPLYELEMNLRPTRPVYLAAMAGAALAFALVWSLRARFRALGPAVLAYALMVSPVLGFLQSGAQKVADRYSYLAMFPLTTLAAAGVLTLVGARPRAGRRAWWGIAVAAALVLLLAGLSWRQTRVWRDSEALYRRVIAVEPDNYFGRHMLSVALWRKGPAHYAEAIEHSKASVAAHPLKGNEPARLWLGRLYRMTGRMDLALQAWREAVEVVPTYTEALLELAGEARARGDLGAAAALFERALERDPAYARGMLELARIYEQSGRGSEALALWRRALERFPNWTAALAALGRAELGAGRPNAALALLGRARTNALVEWLELPAPWPTPEQANPWFAELLTDIGLAQQALGQAALAQAEWRTALQYHAGATRARTLLERAR